MIATSKMAEMAQLIMLSSELAGTPKLRSLTQVRHRFEIRRGSVHTFIVRYRCFVWIVKSGRAFIRSGDCGFAGPDT